jgi:hypothetical protein
MTKESENALERSNGCEVERNIELSTKDERRRRNDGDNLLEEIRVCESIQKVESCSRLELGKLDDVENAFVP